MKLITHNLLACNKPACSGPGVTNFPLKIIVGAEDDSVVRDEDADFNPVFLRGMLPRLEYGALVESARALGVSGLPDELPSIDDCPDDADFWRTLHEALLVLNVIEAVLVCPNCAREFPVTEGVPNMLLHEDELGH